MSNPNWPEGSSPFSDGSQQPADPNAQPAQQSPFVPQPAQPEMNPYGQPAAPAQPPYPYGQPAAPSQPLYPYGQYGQPFDPNAAPTEQTPQPAAPSQPLYPYGQYGQPYGQPAPLPFDPNAAATEQAPQPAAPSQPLYPYGQPAAPSQPLYPYGQPAAPSQPLYPYGQYGQPSQTLPGQPGQFGPPSQAFPGMAPAAQPRSMPRGVIIGAIVALVILLLAGSGTAFAVTQVQPAAANAATAFCGALKSQDYSTAYNALSPKLRAQYTQANFAQDMGVVDKADGTVSSCQQSTSATAYSYSLGSSTATDLILISRGSNSLQGKFHLTNTGNVLSANWKVDTIDTSLLGVNLKAVEATTAFCTALQNKDYTTVSAAFATPPTSLPTAADFTSSGALWDQIDGPITTCAVAGLGTSNDDATASLSLAVTRAKSGAHTSAVTLSASGDTWKISSIDATVFGADLGPLTIGTQFTNDISAGKLSAAYSLTSSDFQSSFTLSQFTQNWQLPAGLKLTFKAELDTYKVSGSTGTYQASVKLADTASGASVTLSMTLSFTKEGGTWKLDAFSIKNA